MGNTITYKTVYEGTLQTRLARPTNWKEICDVTRTNDRVTSTSYISTTGGWAAVQSVTRGTAFNAVDIAETAETMTISTGREVPVFVDWADFYQSPWTKASEAAKRSAQRLNEFTETDVLDNHADWRNIGGTAGNWADNVATTLAVSAGNVDDLIRMVRQVIRAQNGQDLAAEHGIFHVWDPASFNFLEAFAQANGFESADAALKKGLAPQVSYMGATHYVTNDNAANHLFAGVKKLMRVGLLLSLEGRSWTVEFPAGSSGGNLSGFMWYVRRENSRPSRVIEIEKRGELLETLTRKTRAISSRALHVVRKVQRLSLTGVADCFGNLAKYLDSLIKECDIVQTFKKLKEKLEEGILTPNFSTTILYDVNIA